MTKKKVLDDLEKVNAKFLTDIEKQTEADSLNALSERFKATPKELNDLTDIYGEDAVDKLLDVLADVDMIENNTIRKRIRKIAYAIIRGVDREIYDD